MPVGIYKRNPPPLEQYLATRSTKASNGCVEWKGHKTKGGYGLGHHGGLKTTAHRLSYLCFKGEIPNGYEIDHLCKNTSCINPDHLEAVSKKENNRRGARASQTHCVHGHEFNKENTLYKKQNGCRVCRTCKNERWKKQYYQKRSTNK